MPTTPYMSLMLPTVSVTLGPQYATDNNTAFGVIDSHNHTSGQGVQIPSAGININSDLDCNGFNFTELRSTRYDPQGSPIGDVTDLGCLYVAGVDLYFNDVSGNQIQLTAGGALNAASIGGIGGDYTTSNASVFYTSATQTFSFWQDTNQRAKMDVGPILLRKTTASSAAITLEPDAALASGYTITLPAALPGSTTFLGISNTGAVSFGSTFTSLILTGSLSVGTTLSVTGNTTLSTADITTANITTVNATDVVVADDFSVAGDFTISGSGAYAVTNSFSNTVWAGIQRTSGGTSAGPRTYGISSSSGSFSTNSTSFVDVTNLSISFTASGVKPVEIWVISDGTTSNGKFRTTTTGGDDQYEAVLEARRDSTTIGTVSVEGGVNGATGGNFVAAPAGFLVAVDFPSAATYTYKIRIKVLFGDQAALSNSRLYIKEI